MGDYHLASNHFSGNEHFADNHLAGGNPAGVCPNDYFASYHFSASHFRSYHFATVCIPTPPIPPKPPAPGFQTAVWVGGGGGVPLRYKDPCDSSYDDSIRSYTKVLARVKKTLREETHVDPMETLPRKKEAGKNVEREEYIQRLRSRITKLENLILEVKKVRGQRARSQARRLLKLVKSLEARAAEATQEIQLRQEQEAVLEAEKLCRERITDSIMERNLSGVEQPKIDSLTYAALALASGLITVYVVPKKMWMLKMLGYGTTTYLGCKAVNL